ncbi:MAG: Uma2 family endonuclease [Saprospiraceae bacterium]
MFDDQNLASETVLLENPLLTLAQDRPLRFKSQMGKERFHRFILRNSDVRIERDKHGFIIISPPMTLKSAENEGNAFGFLWYWSKTNKLGKAFSPSASFDLPDGSMYKADGAWISNKKLDRLSPDEQDSIALIVPDFVLEVRSKSDSLAQLKKKMTEAWMANGVRLAWLIDPRNRKAWVYRAGAPVEEVPDFSASLSGEDVLPGFSLALSELLEH